MTKRSWTKDRVIHELMRLKEELGRTPVRRDDGGLAWAAQKYFGSWNEAKEVAGLETYRYPTGESPLEMKLLKLLDEKGVVTRSEAVERLGCKRNSISKVLRRSNDISGVRLSTGQSSGRIKYRYSKLFKPGTPYPLPAHLQGPDRTRQVHGGIFKFELSPRIEPGKKMAITRFLRKKVPEETFDYLHSLYTK